MAASSNANNNPNERTVDALLNGGAGNALHPDQEEITGVDQLRETASILWRGKWIIFTVLVVTIGTVGLYTYTAPERYRTSSLLLVEPEQDPMGQKLNLQIQGSAVGGRQDKLANELLVIRQSVELARRVARRLQKMKTVPATGEPLQILRCTADNEQCAAGELLSLNQVVGRLMGERIGAYSTGKNQSAIQINATSTQPGEAAAIANAYAEEYIARTREKSQADIRGSRQFLETQANKLQGRLDSLENRISNYMSRQGATALDQESSRLVEQISTLEAQRDETKIELEMKQASLKAKEKELKKIEPQLAERAASGTESELRQIQQLKAKKELQLEQIYQKNPGLRGNPDQAVRNLKAEIKRLGSRADTLAERYVNESLSVGGIDPMPGEGDGGQGLSYVAQMQEQVAQGRIEVSGLKAKLRTLNQRLNEYRTRLKNIPDQSIQLAQMQRARQSTEKLYTFVIERLQETRIAEESKVAYAEILQSAGVPSAPFAPSKRRNLIMGFLLGLLLGGGLVLLLERLDTRLRRPDDLKDAGHDLAGVIPDMQSFIEDDFDGKESVTVDDREVSTALPMLLSPMSASAEAYRRLRTTIQFSRPDAVVQALMVTSPGAGEGKTTTALNTAIAMAQADRRTLIVDADLRRPQVHHKLDLLRQPGLADVLFENDTLQDALASTGIDNLRALPAGHEVPKPTELLASRTMRDLVEQLRENFDVIVFDTPPIGAFSDATMLSTQCDGSLVVSRAGETDGRAFDHAVETLDEVGANVIGGVLNGFAPQKTGYGYYYGYRYRYQQEEAYYAYYNDDARRRETEA